MADDVTNRGPQDRARISMTEAREVRYWTKELGVSKLRCCASRKLCRSGTARTRQIGRSGTSERGLPVRLRHASCEPHYSTYACVCRKLRPFDFSDCTIAMCGYDFREGHRWDRSRILPLRAFVTFSFFRQTECSKARGLDADGKLFSLVFLHRQRRISRALLFCSHSGPLLGILQSCCHRHLLSPRGPLRVRHLAKKNPAAGGPDTGLRTTKLCQYIRGQSAMAVLPLTRRADSQQPTYQSGGLQRCRR
jgi:Protein of unknown function (DUF3606)